MAIYDNNGTADYEISKMYDNDGTADYQTGKVYDNDGTADSLIYSASPEYLYNYGDECTDDTGGWSVRKFNSYCNKVSKVSGDDYVQIKYKWGGSDAGNASAQLATTNMIDLTDVNTLTAVISYSIAAYAYGRLLSVRPSSGSRVATTSELGSTSKTVSGTKVTVTLDVSSLSGLHYIGPEIRTQGSDSYSTITLYSLKCT